MASSSNLTFLVGNVATDVEVHQTGGGVDVTSFRLAVDRRVREPGSEQWTTRTDGFFTVNCWRHLARNAAASLSKGDRVLVQGRLVAKTWEDGEGNRRSRVEIEAEEVAAALRFSAWSRVRRVVLPEDDPGPDPDLPLPDEPRDEDDQPAAA